MDATVNVQHAKSFPLTERSPQETDHSLPSQQRCSNCALRHICLPLGLTEDDVEALDNIVYFRRTIKRGHPIYRAGGAFEAIYAIRVGSFKTTVLTRDGREQVTGFQMAGEVLGLDGISSEKHTCDAIALEDSEVCVISFVHLEKLCRERESMQRHVHKIMSSEIIREHGFMLMLGNMHAEERLATFLLNLSQRQKARGYSQLEFQLRMSRGEIGNFLGMKLETVSRTFSKISAYGTHQYKPKTNSNSRS